MATPSPAGPGPSTPARGAPHERGHPRIRTFHARHGRTTPAMRRVLDRVGRHHGLPRAPAGTGRDRPLVLEVGCGHGDAALAFADSHPEVDILAVDVHTPGVVTLLRALDDEPRANVLVERGDALSLLDDVIAPGSLAGVHVFFPDPWPKARHHKRRFVRPDVVELLADRMRPGATLLLATDVDGYAATAADVLDAHPAFDGGPTTRPAWRPRSGYEARAVAAGHTVTELAYRRS